MKTEELKAQGLNEEQIAFVMAENGKSIATYKKQAEDAKAEADTYKKKAEEANKLLEGFDGVNVEQLKKDVEKYKEEAKKIEESYKQQIADRDFSEGISKAIRDAKGINEKAIKALLDIESLKASKNQDSDIKAAIEALKTAEDSKMLFTASEEGKKKPSFTDGMGKPNGDSKLTKEEIMKVKDSTERRRLIAENMDLFE